MFKVQYKKLSLYNRKSEFGTLSEMITFILLEVGMDQVAGVTFVSDCNTQYEVKVR